MICKWLITIVQIIVDDMVGFYSNTKNVEWKKMQNNSIMQ